MTHPYGNYVAQRLFEFSDDKVKRKVFDRLKQENLEEIKKNSYGIKLSKRKEISNSY